MKRKVLRRDWSDARAKVDEFGLCRGCGRPFEKLKRMGRSLDAAHIVGRTYDPKSDKASFDRYVHPDAVFPLCGPVLESGTCHHEYDGHRLNMWLRLTDSEREWVIAAAGEGRARRRAEGRRP